MRPGELVEGGLRQLHSQPLEIQILDGIQAGIRSRLGLRARDRVDTLFWRDRQGPADSVVSRSVRSPVWWVIRNRTSRKGGST